ncbi:hypothetical protein UPYG_G00192510 [Umbra pygmaea]|uniref:SEA domain-containing protein n=1 Tax=Umbra pygmaea TaxID=75934 RepID=A0ABD0WGS3_UMBPY
MILICIIEHSLQSYCIENRSSGLRKKIPLGNMGDIELNPMNGFDTVDQRNQRDGNAAMEQTSVDNVDRLTNNNNTHEPTEREPMLSDSASQGEGPGQQQVNVQSDGPGEQQASAVCRLREQLNHQVLWKIRLWMVLIFLFVLIALLVVVSIFLCSVLHQDMDDTYDPALFVLPIYFNGSFQLTNQILTPELLYPASNQSKTLSSQLEQTFSTVHLRPPSRAGISDFRNSSGITDHGSVVAEYWLHFQVPQDDTELMQFTMSRAMVFNIFKQSLYDREPERNHSLYIRPASLNMNGEKRAHAHTVGFNPPTA